MWARNKTRHQKGGPGTTLSTKIRLPAKCSVVIKWYWWEGLSETVFVELSRNGVGGTLLVELYWWNGVVEFILVEWCW